MIYDSSKPKALFILCGHTHNLFNAHDWGVAFTRINLLTCYFILLFSDRQSARNHLNFHFHFWNILQTNTFNLPTDFMLISWCGSTVYSHLADILGKMYRCDTTCLPSLLITMFGLFTFSASSQGKIRFCFYCSGSNSRNDIWLFHQKERKYIHNELWKVTSIKRR